MILPLKSGVLTMGRTRRYSSSEVPSIEAPRLIGVLNEPKL